MPLYEFQCGECGERFERLLWRRPEAAEPPEEVRCGCGSPRVERILFSRVAVGGARTTAEPCAPSGGCCGGGACGMD